MLHDPLALMALGAAALSAVLLVWFLIRKPALTRGIKVMLGCALGILPLTTATSGNVSAFESTKRREFCGGCHVMTEYASDAANPASESLASAHSRNHAFGEESCYACHADYGMFGTVATKIGGLRHVYYHLTEYGDMPLDEAYRKIHLVTPFTNAKCMRCHTTTGKAWNAVPDHAGLADEIRKGESSCVSAGCHGPAHPFSKVNRPEWQQAIEAAKALEAAKQRGPVQEVLP